MCRMIWDRIKPEMPDVMIVGGGSTPYDRDVTAAALRALDEACRACYEQCRKHALEIESCQICGDACRRCAQASQRLLR